MSEQILISVLKPNVYRVSTDFGEFTSNVEGDIDWFNFTEDLMSIISVIEQIIELREEITHEN